MNNNDFQKLKKENEKDDSLIINEDLFEQKDLESDDDQIILNEQRDEECSFFSGGSENEIKKLNILSNNVNIQKDNIAFNENIQKNNEDNLKIENKDNGQKGILISNEKEENKKIQGEYFDDINININTNNNEIKLEDKPINKENINKISQVNNKNMDNNQHTKNIKETKNQNTSKNYFSKKVLYKRNKTSREYKKNIESKENKDNKEIREYKEIKNFNNISNKNNSNRNDNIIQNEKRLLTENSKQESHRRFQKKLLTEKREKSKKSYRDRMKEKKNMKINYENHSKLWNNSSRNEKQSKSCFLNEKNNLSSGREITYDKYGNTTIIKKKQKVIKIEKKLNRSYDNKNNNYNKSNINNFSKNSSKSSFNKKTSKSNNNKINIKANIPSHNKVHMERNESQKSLKEKNGKTETNNTESLKKVLMNKLNKQISEIIKGKENMFFNENKKLFFLSFCDILFELGFLHIKETEINDISHIKNHLNELYTQPFTNKKLLTENFLFNEQKLLICAWKTILNNFVLIKEFDSLPEESEEISLDDFKLFIFIVTGLFIGYNNKCLNENNKLKSESKLIQNKSLSNFRKNNVNKDILKEVKLNQSYTKSSNSNHKYHFRRKSENKIINNINNNTNSSLNEHENILKNILSKRKKSDYNYKIILKIKNFFNYFSDLRKLFNLYKKELKSINKKKSEEKDLTFKPKTNKNNKILLDKFLPNMDFFQRNELMKKRNEKKIIVLQRERSQKMLKECTFEPCKNSKKIEKLNPKEISNRLYRSHNYMNKLHKSANINPNSTTCGKGEKIIYEKKNKEIYHFTPIINKKFNSGMFKTSPLYKDELVNKRIKDLRDANLARFLYNYEKNIRGVLSDDIKKDKNLLKEIIFADKGGMKLDMEKKTNKDTFDNFQNFSDYNLPNYIFNENDFNEPLFTVEIKIKQNIKTIEVFQDDVPEKLAYDFCIENSLGKGSYEKIVNIIKAKLEEIHNGNFNEEVINTENIMNNKVNKEKIHEIINENNNDIINDQNEVINMDMNINNDINQEKENNNINSMNDINEQKDINNFNDEYVNDIEEQHDISTEEIKQKIKEDENNQINNEIDINLENNQFEEENKNQENKDNNFY